MHDVAVTLDLHDALQPDGGRVAHPGQVVAAEVDEHGVLGPLLFVAEKLPLEPVVLLVGGPPRPSARQGAAGDDAPAGAAEDLGARPHQDAARGLEVDHVGARVDDAQRPVDLEGVHPGPALETLAEHDLERVARCDVLLALPHRRLGPLAVELENELIQQRTDRVPCFRRFTHRSAHRCI